MIFYTNECCDCGLPCLYEGCPYYKVKHFKCDFCKEENVKLYDYNGYEICEACLLKEFEVIEGSDEYL